jgi:putative MATE family efflux protein
MNGNTEALGRERVGALVLKFSIPSVVGMLVNGLYNVMDRIFVGRGVGAEALAGVAIVFPLMLLVMAMGMLIGLGASSLIALKLGEGKREEAEATVGTAATMSIVLGLAMTIGVGVFMRPILVFFGGTGIVLDYAMRFTAMFLPGIFLQIVAFSLNNMIRGQGDPVTALLTMVISAGVNCALNPLFIFGFKMGIVGSALATDIAQAVSCTWLLAVFLTTKKGLRLRPASLKPSPALAKDILGIGMVPSFVQIATVATIILANHLIVAYGGATGIATLGIASSLISLMLMPIIGINVGIQPIIGYNYGAKLYDRARKALRISVIATCAVCSTAYALFWAFSAETIRLFVRNAPDVVSMGISGLRIYFGSMPILAVVVLGSGYFQAVKKPVKALVPNMIRQLILLVPLYLILPRFFGIDGVWMASPIADAASLVFTLAFLLPEMKRLKTGSGRGTEPPPVLLLPATESA